MKSVKNSVEIKDVFSIASNLVSLSIPIVGAFMNGNMAYLWFIAWLIQFFFTITIVVAYRFGRSKQSETEKEARECLELLSKKSINFLREIANSKDDLVVNLDGSINIGKRDVSRRNFDNLAQFGLIEKSPSESFANTVYRISRKGCRVLALIERS